MSKFAIFVDLQHDFTFGTLANPAAIEKLQYLKEEVELLGRKGYRLVFTKDTHAADEEEYKNTLEGQYIPYHCGDGTAGREIVEPIKMKLYDAGDWCIRKETFGSTDLIAYLQKKNLEEPIDEIRFYGFVTEICVVSNALLVRTFFPNVRIVVDAAGCAGLTTEGHAAALTVMKACLIEVVNE
ncbi:MAG: cysteine hydrolase family protein [Candidatus Nomurabacteria bacterium]|jgi:nicotinamidase-related amidase|nr:cysteine hydrolase family protein [Candidatus Nomurabacteria bacterium]